MTDEDRALDVAERTVAALSSLTPAERERALGMPASTLLSLAARWGALGLSAEQAAEAFRRLDRAFQELPELEQQPTPTWWVPLVVIAIQVLVGWWAFR